MDHETAVDACGDWDNTECAGTPSCPPRCPRFVDKLGTALLVLPPEAVGPDAETLVDLYDCGPEGHTLSYPPYRTRSALVDWLADLMGRARSFVALNQYALLPLRLPLEESPTVDRIGLVPGATGTSVPG